VWASAMAVVATIRPVSGSRADTPASAAASAAFWSWVRAAASFATSTASEPNPIITSRKRASQMITAPRWLRRDLPRRLSTGSSLLALLRLLRGGRGRGTGRAVGRKLRQRGGRRQHLRRDHDQQLALGGAGDVVREEPADHGNGAEDRDALHVLRAVGLLEAADHQVLSALEADGRGGATHDDARHVESLQREGIVEVELAHLGVDDQGD